MWVFFFHTYVLEKYRKDKITMAYVFLSTFINTMPIWGNNGVLVQNGRGKVNRSAYYDIDILWTYTISKANIDLRTTLDVI